MTGDGGRGDPERVGSCTSLRSLAVQVGRAKLGVAHPAGLDQSHDEVADGVNRQATLWVKAGKPYRQTVDVDRRLDRTRVSDRGVYGLKQAETGTHSTLSWAGAEHVPAVMSGGNKSWVDPVAGA